MARSFTPKDARALIALMVEQGTGQSNVSVVSTADFVSAGELLMATGMENVYNTINMVMGRLIVASRQYRAKLKLMDEYDNGVYTSLVRKISFYTKGPKNSGAFNTDLFLNLADGFTNGENYGGTPPNPQSTKSMWEQNQQYPLEMNFGGSNTWQNCITLYEEQVQVAFRDESEFIRFVEGYLNEHRNDIELQREAWNRMCLLNKIGSVIDMSAYMPGSAIDLVAGFNARYGTSYTGTQLRTTYIKEFLAYFVATFKLVSQFMTEKSVNYHWSVPKTINGDTYYITRFTPYADQRVYLYSPLFKEAETMVLPEIFNPEYLDIKTQYQEISFWQGLDDRAKINVTPAITDADPSSPTYGTQIAGSNVTLPYVVGMITDRQGLITNMMLDRVASTPLEPRKLFRNTWQTFLKGVVSDNTENCVVFYMAS